jgi:hypothetical protein
VLRTCTTGGKRDDSTTRRALILKKKSSCRRVVVLAGALSWLALPLCFSCGLAELTITSATLSP